MGEQPLWGRFWELAALTPVEMKLLTRARAAIAADLQDYGTQSDRYGLIHADLVPENLLMTASAFKSSISMMPDSVGTYSNSRPRSISLREMIFIRRRARR